MPADTDAVTGARRVARTVLALIAVTVMVGTGMAWGKIRSFEGGIFHFDTAELGGGGQDGAIDILLVGMDSRTDAHGNPLSAEELATLHAGDDVSTNTDTIILVRIPNNGKSATAISIPRDSYVEAPGLDKTKINGVYGQVKLDKMKQLVEVQGMDPAEAEPKAVEAGREALIKTVADLTGVTVDHYAEIGLLGFSLITDALGGVDVCLKDAVYEPLSGADFPAGWQKLNGPQALSFVRQRHDLPRGDLDRVVRQQVVMAQLAHQVISGKTLTSPATLNRLEDAIQRSVVLSSGWDIMDFIKQLEHLAGGSCSSEDTVRLFASLSLARLHPDVTSWAAAAEALNMPGPMGVRCARACSATMLVSADEWKSRIWRAGKETERRDYRATEAKIHHRLGMTRWFNEWARRNRPDARYGDHDLALTWQWIHVAHAHLDLSPIWRGRTPTAKERARHRQFEDSLSGHQQLVLAAALHRPA